MGYHCNINNKELNFSKKAWKRIKKIYQAIINHPFHQEIIQGTLEQKRFHFYIKQDYLFLQAFSKSLFLIANRVNESKLSEFFVKLATNTEIAIEKIILPLLINKNNKNLSLSSIAYTNYLLNISTNQSIELAISAILPCYWIYHEVGQYIIENTRTTSNNFKQWMIIYAPGNTNSDLVEIIKIFNKLASNSTQEIQQQMYDEFYKSSVLEWHFWDDAYRMKNYDTLS